MSQDNQVSLAGQGKALPNRSVPPHTNHVGMVFEEVNLLL